MHLLESHPSGALSFWESAITLIHMHYYPEEPFRKGKEEFLLRDALH